MSGKRERRFKSLKERVSKSRAESVRAPGKELTDASSPGRERFPRTGGKQKQQTYGRSAFEKDPLAKLRADFDALVAGMQTSKAKAAAKGLFAATGKELGAIAQAHAKRHSVPKLTRERSMQLSELLKQHRRRTSLSANEVADRAEVGRSYYFEIEQGKRANISLLIAVRLSQVLKVSLRDLAAAALKSVNGRKKQ